MPPIRRQIVKALLVCLALLFVPTGGFAQASSPVIVADHAIIVDADTGTILWEHGANDVVAIASLTKLFTGFLALEQADRSQRMTIHQSDLVGEASMGLMGGEELSFNTLLYGMLLPSGNDAATAIARNIGDYPGATDEQAIQRFLVNGNARLAELGLTSTRLTNPHGLDQPGHVSSAHDVAALARYAMLNEPELLAVMGTPTYTGEGHQLANTNRLLGTYAGLLGGKTGLTDNAGNCLLEIAQRDGHTVIIVLLGSTAEAWYDDARALLDFGFSRLALPGAGIGGAQVAPGAESQVAAPTQPVAANRSVERPADEIAVVSTTLAAPQPASRAWAWPTIIAILTVGAIAVVLQLHDGLSLAPARRRARAARRAAEPVDITPTPGFEQATREWLVATVSERQSAHFDPKKPAPGLSYYRQN